nr:50S ribosomal protein L21 [Candidatus Bipolaricaulota bacterium]
VSVGDELSFDKVLLIVDKDDVRVGTPYLEGATVNGTLDEEGRGDKVIVYKFKRKKGYRRKQGHRQAYMRTRVTAIVG